MKFYFLLEFEADADGVAKRMRVRKVVEASPVPARARLHAKLARQIQKNLSESDVIDTAIHQTRK